MLPDRLAAVLAVVYLIFSEGYGTRSELAAEALRLARALAELMPDEPEVHGLLALMALHEGRRPARFAGGELVLLADQDRSLWDAASRSSSACREAIIACTTYGPRPWTVSARSSAIRPAAMPPDALSWSRRRPASARGRTAR